MDARGICASHGNFVGSNLVIKGDHNVVRGSNVEVLGNHNTVKGPNAKVYGDNNTVKGPNAKVWGIGNKVKGVNSVAKGHYNTVSGTNSRAYGAENRVTGVNSRSFTSDGTLIKQTKQKKHKSVVHMGPTRVYRGNAQNRSIRVIDGDIYVGGNIGGARVNLDLITSGGSAGIIGNVGDGGQTNIHRELRPPSPPSRVSIADSVSPEFDHEAPEDAPDDVLCAICADRVRCCLVAPCGHRALCCTCALALYRDKEVADTACVVCRKPAESVLRVFD